MSTETPLWFELSIASPKDNYQIVEDWLLSIGALSVTYFDPDDNPIFDLMDGQQHIWEQCHIKGLFDANQIEPENIEAITRKCFSEQTVYSNFLENQCWETSWMEHFKPIQFGEKLWIIPSHHEPVNSQDINILLDPGLAFGSGSHPTTQLCLSWLEQHVTTNSSVIDYGCGSGILAIAAKKLGAPYVEAYDIDPQALIATQDNCAKNQTQLDLIDIKPKPDHDYQASIVIANILANPLCELKPIILNLLQNGGKLALSGILEEQAEWVKAAYNEEINWIETQQMSGWVILYGAKR